MCSIFPRVALNSVRCRAMDINRRTALNPKTPPLVPLPDAQAVKRDPTNPAYRNNLAAALSKIGDFNSAKAACEKVHTRRNDGPIFVAQSRQQRARRGRLLAFVQLNNMGTAKCKIGGRQLIAPTVHSHLLACDSLHHIIPLT